MINIYIFFNINVLVGKLYMEDFIILVSPILAIISSFFIVYTIRFLDVIEKEPLKTIFFAFIAGIISTVLTVILQTIFPTPASIISSLGNFNDSTFYNLQVIFDAPIIEEFLKLFCLLILYRFFKKEFHSLTDFIVYACIVATGFQFIENLIYLFGTLNSENLIYDWVEMANSRLITSGYMHLLWTGWSGLGLWILKQKNSKDYPSIFFFCLIAISLHALNNLAAVLEFPFLYEIIRSVSLAGFISLLGISIIRDVKIFNEFVKELYLLKSFNKDQIVIINELEDPIINIFAKYKWSWRIFNYYNNPSFSRNVYNDFSLYALSFSDDFSEGNPQIKKNYLTKAFNLISSIS